MDRSAPAPRAVVAVVLFVLLAPRPSVAGAGATGFDESQRLTAVDVVVGFSGEGVAGWATGPAPRSPKPGDFAVRVDDLDRPVISVGPLPSWDVVLWFLTDRSRTALLRRSAIQLVGAVDGLTGLGSVEVVVADPEPTVVARDVSDPGRLRSILGDIARTIEGRDEIVGLRDEVRRELAAVERGEGRTGMGSEELVSAALAEEVRIVRSAHDRLAVALADRPVSGAGRLVVLVAGGFDLDPGRFWEASGRVDAAAPVPEKSVRELGRLLSSYGWVVVTFDPEPEEPLRDGWTIGKWRSAGLGVEQKRFWDPVLGEEHDQTLIGWRWKRESQRQPKKAEALLQLGESLRTGGKIEEAVDSYQDALYHFAGHRRTADRQAMALLGLGRALEALGEVQEARRAFRLSRVLDPEAAGRELGPSIDVISPREAPRRLVEATAGALIEEADELSELLDELGHRIRLTLQLEGWPDGRVHPLAVDLAGSWRDPVLRKPVAPRWIRHSTPELLAAARLRRTLAGDVLAGPLHPTVRRDDDVRLELRADLGPIRGLDGPEVVRWRISLARAGAVGEEPRIEHHLGDPGPLPEGATWGAWLEGEARGEGVLAVLVEDLASGAWGLALGR